MSRVLVIEDTSSLRDVLAAVLSSEGFAVSSASSAEEGIKNFKNEQLDLVLCDLKLPKNSGLDFLKEAREINSDVPILVMTAYGNIDIAVQAMKLGATDFITKPFDPSMLCDLLKQVVEHKRLYDRDGKTKATRKLLTQSPVFETVIKQAKKVAPLSTPVMLLGESGTGKDLLARLIHQFSSRHNGPFVAINCASTPDDLLESEFFGHESGAFTGATQRRIGLFEVANQGTIFLDEIGDMPANLQVKLLRTLQESEIKRVGSNQTLKINARVISATNSDIEQAIKTGNFRPDLYYRLGVVVLNVPPLRKRPEDIGLLANYFLKCFSEEKEGEIRELTPEALALLESYDWPGNVRELENAIERALIFSDGPLGPDCFQLGKDLKQDQNKAVSISLPAVAASAVRNAEVAAILRVMALTDGNKSKAAKILGVSYKTLLNKFKEYQLEKNSSHPKTEEDSQLAILK